MNEQVLPQKKIIFIVNPISGHGKQSDFGEAVESFLDKGKFRFKIFETELPGHATTICQSAIQEGADIVVAVGGDGTVNETARALVGTGILLGVVPTGSGNGLARHLHLPFGFKRAIEVINRSNSMLIDTATIDGQVFVSVAGVGFDALVARKFAKSPKRGFLSYARITISSYFSYKPKKYMLTIDGQEILRRALMISFANSSQFGNNTSIDPGAMLDDGLIDVCIVKRVPIRRLPIVSPLLFLHRFDRTDYVEIIKAREVRVTRKRGKYIHIDGDPVQCEKTFEVKILPLSLNIIIP